MMVIQLPRDVRKVENMEKCCIVIRPFLHTIFCCPLGNLKMLAVFRRDELARNAHTAQL